MYLLSFFFYYCLTIIVFRINCSLFWRTFLSFLHYQRSDAFIRFGLTCFWFVLRPWWRRKREPKTDLLRLNYNAVGCSLCITMCARGAMWDHARLFFPLSLSFFYQRGTEKQKCAKAVACIFPFLFVTSITTFLLLPFLWCILQTSNNGRFPPFFFIFLYSTDITSKRNLGFFYIITVAKVKKLLSQCETFRFTGRPKTMCIIRLSL